jgi:ribosome-binding protein aMBF1 (putative translation factor)
VQFGNNAHRILCFSDKNVLVLTHGFLKKTRRAPETELARAINYKRYFFKKETDMSELQKYIEKRKKQDPEFAVSYDSVYEEFKIGVFIREARKKSGLTQEELARRAATTKSAISRIENHAEDIKLSTIEKVAKALGKKVIIQIK